MNKRGQCTIPASSRNGFFPSTANRGFEVRGKSSNKARLPASEKHEHLQRVKNSKIGYGDFIQDFEMGPYAKRASWKQYWVLSIRISKSYTLSQILKFVEARQLFPSFFETVVLPSRRHKMRTQSGDRISEYSFATKWQDRYKCALCLNML